MNLFQVKIFVEIEFRGLNQVQRLKSSSEAEIKFRVLYQGYRLKLQP